jgi:hypothetical protein
LARKDGTVPLCSAAFQQCDGSVMTAWYPAAPGSVSNPAFCGWSLGFETDMRERGQLSPCSSNFRGSNDMPLICVSTQEIDLGTLGIQMDGGDALLDW